MQTAEIRHIVVELPIEAPVDKVWKIMIDEISDWWPVDFLSIPTAKEIKLEPWAGGRLYEEAPDGQQILWATVVMIVPGKVIEFIGGITPSYGGPTFTTHRFEVKEEGSGTRFRLSDASIGPADEENAANLTEGWNYLAGKLKEYVEAKVAAG